MSCRDEPRLSLMVRGSQTCSSVLGQDRNAQGGHLVTKKSHCSAKLRAGSEGLCVQLPQLLSLQGIQPQSTEATLALSHHIKNYSR